MSAHVDPPSGRASGQPRPPHPNPKEQSLRWSAGIINHGTYDDLENCLAGLARQSESPAAIAVYDTGESPERLEKLRHAYSDVAFRTGPNHGYAGGANRIVRFLSGLPDPVDFMLILNPDVAPEPDYACRLIREMTQRPEVAIATGKLLRPDRATLDSAGIVIPRNRRPRDRGSDQRDLGQFDVTEFVDAASGAAMMLRESALDELRIDGELFDESFFAYHEDTDLCWRARLFGWKILYEPRAVALHGRRWRRGRRTEISVEIRRHSFKNHYLQIVKNETADEFVGNLPWLIAWEFFRMGLVLVRDRPMFSAYRDAWRALPAARRKRMLIQQRARRLALPVNQPSSVPASSE